MEKQNYITDGLGNIPLGQGDVALSEDEGRKGRVVMTLMERTMAFNQRRVNRHPNNMTREEAYQKSCGGEQ